MRPDRRLLGSLVLMQRSAWIGNMTTGAMAIATATEQES